MASSSSEIPAVLGNWYLQECLGSGYSGSFFVAPPFILSTSLTAFPGAIYKAFHIHTHQIAAIKVQSRKHECPTNRYERAIYPLLMNAEGMPTLYASGVEGNWDYLVMELLGSSLDSLMRKSGKNKMDLRSVCCIAMQIVSAFLPPVTLANQNHN
jgi:casein kinase 1